MIMYPFSGRSFKDLQQKYDNLAATVEQLVTVRSRRSMNSPGHAVDGRSKSSKCYCKKVVTI